MIKLQRILGWSTYHRTRAMPRVAAAALIEEHNAAHCICFTFAGKSFAFHDTNGAAKALQAGSFKTPLPIMLMAAVTRSQGLFLDVGANNGLYSILAAKTRPEAV